MSQPEESQEKTSKVDDILLKPVLKDLDELREGEGDDDDARPPDREDQAGDDEE
jgi:hypothetical protein